MKRVCVLSVLFLCCNACFTPSSTKRVEVDMPADFGSQPEAKEAKATSGALRPWREVFRDERLIALIEESLQHNADRAIALERVAQARAGLHAATGAMLPTVSATANAGLRRFGLFTMDGAGNATTDITPGQLVPEHLPDFLAGFQTAWELDVWGRLWSQRQASLSRVLAAEEMAHVVEVNLIAAVAQAWLELGSLDATLAVLDKTRDRQEKAVALLTAQKDAGRVTNLAVQQFEAEVRSTRAKIVELRRALSARERALYLLVGRVPAGVERQLGNDVIADVPVGVPAELLVLRPDVRATALEVRAAGLDVRAATAAFLPGITVGGAVGLQAFNPAYLLNPQSIAYTALGGLLAPVLNRAAIEADHAAASSLQREAVIAHHQAMLTAWLEVENALTDVRATDELHELARERRDGLNTATETADLLFQAGRANWMEVLMASTSAADAELELIEAAQARLAARVDVYRSVGGGWTSTTPTAPTFAAHPLDGLFSDANL